MDDTESSGSKTPSTFGPPSWIALGLIVLFVAVLVTLGFLRADANWDQLIYLLSGFEAIVFAAVGTLFGVSVSRGSVESAREDAVEAKAETRLHKAEVQRMSEVAAEGRAMAETVLAKLRTSTFLGKDMVEIANMAVRLYPDLANEDDRALLQEASEILRFEAQEGRRAQAEYDARRLGRERGTEPFGTDSDRNADPPEVRGS